MRRRIVIAVDKRTLNNPIEARVGNWSFAVPGSGERTVPVLLSARDTRYIQTRAQGDAAIDGEDILTQAEEANAFDTIG